MAPTTKAPHFPAVTFRDSGLFMGRYLVDHGGTPGDPSDDEFIAYLGDLKEVRRRDTFGRDYCEDLAAFLG